VCREDRRLRLILDGRHAGHNSDSLEGVELPSGAALGAFRWTETRPSTWVRLAHAHTIVIDACVQPVELPCTPRLQDGAWFSTSFTRFGVRMTVLLDGNWGSAG